MYVKYYDEARNKYTVMNMDESESVVYHQNELGINKSEIAIRYDDDQEGLDRMNDIVEALDSDNVVVYDLTKEVGYWKPKTHKKPGPKPKPTPKSE